MYGEHEEILIYILENQDTDSYRMKGENQWEQSLCVMHEENHLLAYKGND